MEIAIKTETETYPLAWIRSRLICEFTHWDICLSGLVDVDGKRMLCRAAAAEDGNVGRNPVYTLHEVNWTDECTEYLNDYKQAYHHWFYANGTRCRYDGRDLPWFSKKWQHRNPIAEAAAGRGFTED